MKGIVLSCSRTKSIGPASAIELYDGPRWRTLRAVLRQVKNKPAIFVFSAQYGIISAGSIISKYDNTLKNNFSQTPPNGLTLLDDYSFLHLSMGTQYAASLKPFLRQNYEWSGDRGLGDQRAAIWYYLIRYDIEMERDS